MEFTDLEGHFEDDLVVVVVQDSQKPVERLDGPLEVEVEAESLQNLDLEVDEHLLVDVLLLLLGQQTNHAGETWRDRLLQLGGKKYTDCCEADHVMLREVEDSDGVDVPVENGCGGEQAFGLVLFFLVQVKDLLDAV